ncbi:MAG: hypothetical protein ACRBK7_27625 [Acidimicrobiales bacterium]
MNRPTARLDALQKLARDSAVALDASDLGAARATRHSFARSFLRLAARERWTVTREVFELDDDGRGTVIYRVDYHLNRDTNGDTKSGMAEPVRLVAFPTVVEESQRNDRVIAETWDLTAALCRGPVDAARIDALRQQVSTQEGGRADVGTLVWTRANRSARFFDHVVERLANGQQPEPSVIGDGAYVMRSTAFYANGKWGLTDFEGCDEADPLAVPYRAQMLTAWLVRELSLDLVDHCAARRGSNPTSLDREWRRYFGLGNATGLGMVPYVINHPQVFDAWVAVRELPLANALKADWSPDSSEAALVVTLLDRAVCHFAERPSLSTEPYLSGPVLADLLAPIAAMAERYCDGDAESLPSSPPSATLATRLHKRAAEAGAEVRAIVDSILVEVDESLDDEIELLLRVDERARTGMMARCSDLQAMIDSAYAWVREFDFADPDESARFWFSSADSQEPRRGFRGIDPGESVEHAIDVARRISELADALVHVPDDRPVVEFVLDHPAMRWAVDRVYSCHDLVYGEPHVNPLGERFLPLDLQRFQLAAYGMENFSPQSTDWLRVTLYAGAPRVQDVAAGVDDDWSFAAKPQDAPV